MFTIPIKQKKSTYDVREKYSQREREGERERKGEKAVIVLLSSCNIGHIPLIKYSQKEVIRQLKTITLPFEKLINVLSNGG